MPISFALEPKMEWTTQFVSVYTDFNGGLLSLNHDA